MRSLNYKILLGLCDIKRLLDYFVGYEAGAVGNEKAILIVK